MEGIPITTKQQYDLLTCDLDAEQAQDIALTCGADLLIWGWQYRDSISGREVLDLQYYATNTSGEAIFLEGTAGTRKLLMDELELGLEPLDQQALRDGVADSPGRR